MVNLNLAYISYNPLDITDIGFYVNLPDLTVTSSCSESGFLPGGVFRDCPKLSNTFLFFY
jgi:hypothetical protein